MRFPVADRAAVVAQEALSSSLLVSHIGRKFDDSSVKATVIFRDFFFVGKMPSPEDLDFLLSKLENEPGIPKDTNPVKILELLSYFGTIKMRP